MKRFFRWFLRIALTVILLAFIAANGVIYMQTYHFMHTVPPRYQARPEKLTDWERQKLALFGQPVPRKPIDAVPLRPYQNVELPSKDGLRLRGWYIPAERRPKGTIIIYHGYGQNRSGDVGKAFRYGRMGFNVSMIDFRAHGESQGFLTTIGLYERADVKAAYDWVKARTTSPVILNGTSMGAAAILSAVAYYRDFKPDLCILESCFGTIRQAVRGSLRSSNFPQDPLVDGMVFWSSVQLWHWMYDFKPQAFARNVTCPTLVLWGDRDPRVTREETYAIYHNLSSRKKQLVIFNRGGHEGLVGQNPDLWLEMVARFLKVPNKI